jgi:hypothetical protein
MGGVERGERNLSFEKLCAIALALGCDGALGGITFVREKRQFL